MTIEQRVSAAAQALWRNLLPGRQLDLCRADRRSRPPGRETQTSRSAIKDIYVCWYAMPDNGYAASSSGKQIPQFNVLQVMPAPDRLSGPYSSHIISLLR